MDQLIDQAVDNFAVPGVIYVVHLIGAYFWEHLPEVQPHNHAVNGTIQPAESLLPVEATMVTQTEICKITKFIELTEFETETQTIDKCGPTVFKNLPEVNCVDTQTTSTQRVVDASQKALSTTPMDWESRMWWILLFMGAVLVVALLLALLVWTCFDGNANDDPPAPSPGGDGGGNDVGGGGGVGGDNGDDGKNNDGEPPEDESPDSDDDSSSGDGDAGPSADNNDAGPPEDDREAIPAEDMDAEAPETDEAVTPDAFTYQSSEDDDAGSSANDAGLSENQDAESLRPDGAVPPDDSIAGHLRGDDTRSPENDDHAGAPEGDNAGTGGDGDGAGALPEDDDHATSPVGDIAGGATDHDAGVPANGADGATVESSSANAQDSQSTNDQSSHSSWISLKPLTQWLSGLPSSSATDSDPQDQLAKLRHDLKASEEKRAQTMAELRASNEKRAETMVGFKEALESRRKAEEDLAKVKEQLSRQNNATANSTKASHHAAEFTPAERREEHEIARLQARVAELEANQRPTEGGRAASLNTGSQTREHDQCPYSREEILEVMRDQERLRTRLVEHIPYLEQALKDAITRREKAKNEPPGFAGDRGGRPDVERTREDCDRAKKSLQKSREVSSKLSLWHPGPLGTQSQERDHTDDEAPAGDREDDPCAEVRADLRAAHAKIGRLQTFLLELEVENAALKSQGSTTRQPPVPSNKEIRDLNRAKFSGDKDARWFAIENATLRETNRRLRAAQNNANPLGSALNVQAAPHLAMQGSVIAESSMRLVRELGRAYERIKELESVNQAMSNAPSPPRNLQTDKDDDPCKEVKDELQAAQKKIVTLEAEVQGLEKLLTKPDQLAKDGSASKSKEGGPGPDGDADPCKEWKDALEESRQDVKRMEKLRNVEIRLRKAAETTTGQFYAPDVWDELRTEHKLDVNQTMDENRELTNENKKLKHKVERLSRGGKSNAEDENDDDLCFDNNGAFGPLRKPSGFGKGAFKKLGSTKPEVKVDPCKEVKADLSTAKAEVERLTAELETAKAKLAAKKSAEARPETESTQTQTGEDPCKEEKIKLAAAEREVESLAAQLAEAKAPKKAKTLDEEIYGGRASWDKTRSRNFLQEKVDRLEKEVNRLEKELGELKEMSSSQETEKAAKELQEKVDSATKERDAAREEVEKLKGQLATAGSDLTTNQTAKEKVIADLVTAEGARKTAEKELATLREELKTATAALQESLTADKVALTAKEIALAKCKVEIVDLNEKVKTANNARLASLTADKEALNAKDAALATCEAEKVKLQKQLEDDNKPAPTTTPSGGVKSRTTLEIELNQAVKKISKLEKDLQSAKKLNNAKVVLEENGNPARNPCQKYIDELAKEKAEVKRLKDEIARLKRLIQNLQNRLETTPDWRPDDADGEDGPEDDKPDQGKAANPKDIAGTPQAGGAAPKPATSSGQKQPGGDKATEAGSTADNPVDLEPDSNREAEKAPSPPSDAPLKQPPSAPVFEPEDRSLRDYAIKGNDFSDDSADEQSVKDDSRDSDDENETPVALAPNDVPEIDDLLKYLGVGGNEATKGPLLPPVAPDEQPPIPIAEDERDTQVSKGKSDEAEAPAQDPTAVALPTSPNQTGTSNPHGGPNSDDNWSVARDVAELRKKMAEATQVDQRHEKHPGGFREQRPMPAGGDERVLVEMGKQKSAEADRKLREILRKLDEEPPEVGNVSDSDYSSVTSHSEVDAGEFDEDDDKKGGDSDGDNDGDDPPPPTRKPMPAASQGRNASVLHSVVPAGSQGQSNIPVDPRRQSLPSFEFSSAPHPPGHRQNGESSTRPTSSPQPSTMTHNIPTAAGGPDSSLLGASTGQGKRGIFPLEPSKAPFLDAQSAPRANSISPAPQKPMPPANAPTGQGRTGSLPTGQAALPPVNAPFASTGMPAAWAQWYGPNAKGGLALPPQKSAATGPQASVLSSTPAKPAAPPNAQTASSRAGSLPTGQVALPPLNSQTGSRSMQPTASAPSPSLGGLFKSVHAPPAAGTTAEPLPDIRRAQSPVAEEERFQRRGRFAEEQGKAGDAGKSETGSGSGGSRTGGSANRGRSGSGSSVSGRGSKGGIIGSRKQKRPSKEDPSEKEDS
ncbi:hypothetical protein TI39_contig70g00008 [Zymoseptoria brevis]|uniref:Uncharacterized protein n=1 Tax=Zymoseptoria brevis TaxID=1047168 RepID=A0A0F4GXV1_9PEZI|nr:hypothetical protein TI39_contig70g00008 [Zymoseptoria brevis]